MKSPTLWSAFTSEQRMNIFFYSLGIMSYKFALEYFNGAFLTMSNERFGENRYAKMGLLTGLNYAAQGFGSIIISPLIKRLPTRYVLCFAVILFALVSALILIIDAATGGQVKFKTIDHVTHYGNWSPNILFPIFTLSGISYGMIELIRRVIPRDIVGGDPDRLKKMDAIVHVLYETAGTIAAFTSSYLIDVFGYNYSSFLSPLLFAISALAWWYLDMYGINSRDKFLRAKVEYSGQRASSPISLNTLRDTSRCLSTWWTALKSFAKAFYYGAFLCLTYREFIWLIPSYTLALYGHRYLENGILQIYAKTILGRSSLAQILVGGSNLGELLGAAGVMIFSEVIPTPLPWLRLDAMFLNLAWIIPFFPCIRGQAISAWKLAPIMIPISFGWAGGDCSLTAYIQSTLAKIEDDDEDISALGSVMAFLYVMYLILYSVTSTLLGRWVDSRLKGLDEVQSVEPARFALKMVGGVQFSVISAIVLAATFIPKGSIALNPRRIRAVPSDRVIDDEAGSSSTFNSVVFVDPPSCSKPM